MISLTSPGHLFSLPVGAAVGGATVGGGVGGEGGHAPATRVLQDAYEDDEDLITSVSGEH